MTFFTNRLIQVKDFFRMFVQKHGRLFNRSQVPQQETISEILDKLSNCCIRLKNICQTSEPFFIKLGNDLQTVHLNTSELTQLIFEIVNLIQSDSQTGLFYKAQTIADEAMKELRQRYTNVMNNLDQVNVIITHLSKLYKLCNVIEKIALFLRIIGLNIDIESARSSVSKEMFGVVAKDMRRLSDTVIQISEKMKNNSNNARQSQLAAHREIFNGVNQLKSFSDAAEVSTQTTVKEIELFMNELYKVVDQARVHSETVSSQVADIVVGIQLHDSINQRMDHIIEALNDAKDKLKGYTSNIAIENVDDVGAAYAVIQLQSEQLKQVIHEIEHVYGKNLSAFATIKDHTMLLSKNFETSIAEKYIESKETTDLFGWLKTTIFHLHDLLEKGRKLITQIEQTTNQAIKEISPLSELMDQLRMFSINTHLIALNAIIKATQIGESGATLEVLSQEMSKLSIQTNEFASTVEKILVEIHNTAEELNTLNMKAREASPVGRARARLKSGLSEILDIYKNFNEKRIKVLNQSESIQAMVSTIQSHLSFMSNTANEFKEQLNELNSITNSLSHWATQYVGVSQLEFTKIAERYTMQKERDIHQRVIENNNKMSKPIAPANDHVFLGSDHTTPQKESLGDNVELF